MGKEEEKNCEREDREIIVSNWEWRGILREELPKKIKEELAWEGEE